MSAEAPLLVRSFGVGKRTVTLTVPTPVAGRAITMTCEWEPDAPTTLTAAEIAQYRAGRDIALRELGVGTIVVEVQ